MPKNLEMKARISRAEHAHLTARRMQAHFEGILYQSDTYFNVQQGRLKLREIKDSRSELIFYLREESSSQRVSHYQVCAVQDAASLKIMLEQSLGIRAAVQKTRSLYLLEDVRIHIDAVEGLGSFIEFEIPFTGARSSADPMMDRLIGEFGVRAGDVIQYSYVDLMLHSGGKA